MQSLRTAEVSRKTQETAIDVRINLDGTGRSEIDTGIGFLDHMLDQIARHGLVDLTISAKGDLQVDGHHTVEDIGITLGQALLQALGDKRGIRRYGFAYVPLDEALSRVVIDLSGRPGLVFEAPFTAPMIGELDTQLIMSSWRRQMSFISITCAASMPTIRPRRSSRPSGARSAWRLSLIRACRA